MLKDGLLYERATGDKLRCNVCQRRCVIPPGEYGYCRTRIHREGKIQSTIYGTVSSAAADPIEKKPVFHFKPGSRVFSMGSYGCNFRCLFCQNWQIAYANGAHAADQLDISPEQAVRMAKESGCEGVAWTYNEPAIWLEYALDTAKLAKAAGLYTVYVTNGSATEEGLDVIGPYLDVYRVDLKSMSREFYRKLIKTGNPEGVRRVAERAQKKWGMHVEVVTNVIPGHNDSPDELRSIAAWIRDGLGELTPWHVTRFFPHAQMMDVPATPVATLQQARKIALAEGLKFVYLGNVAGAEEENTYCPVGGEVVVSRSYYRTHLVGVSAAGTCLQHGAPLNLVL
ncbi:MAG: AmmeMemoRadiSam system radical SAM enzyme [Chloroflexota bacterium]